MSRSPADSPPSPRPPHHTEDGKFRTPWTVSEEKRGFGALLRWQWERLTSRLPPDPPPEALPAARPAVARPRAPAEEIRITWIGHASFLVQIGGMNLLLDPVFSERASPLQWVGPKRLAAPGMALADLPPVDVAIVSHDHYDHLDDPTVRYLHRRFGGALRWVTPLGYAGWLERRGIRENVTELDWWDGVSLTTGAGEVRVACAPAQHWTRRGATEFNDRLWASFAITTPAGRGIYFGADSGYFPGYPEIGERLGPFDALLLPVGAYEPRWFMKPVHMNPEEAVRAYRELGGRGAFVAMHWGTFRLTDEDPLEPPVRTRRAWAEAGLPPEDLCILRHGETLAL